MTGEPVRTAVVDGVTIYRPKLEQSWVTASAPPPAKVTPWPAVPGVTIYRDVLPAT